MAEHIRRIKYFILLIIFILAGCANQLPPTGGPVDKTPPEVIAVYPSNGSTNFSGGYIEFTFSEYVEKRNVREALFISPAVSGDLKFEWSGKNVRIFFGDSLRGNMTYTVTLGTDLIDLNNRNRLANAFVLTFSTGDQIDNGVISGKVFAERPSGIFIFAYNTEQDTADPTRIKPRYLSQTGTEGIYSFAGLAPGTYRVFALQDAFKDQLFQPDQDKIGIPPCDVFLTRTDTVFNGLNFFLSTFDTTKPHLFSAVMTDRNHILVSFSESLDTSAFHPEHFSIYDSLSAKRFPPLLVFSGRAKETEIILSIPYDSTFSEKMTVTVSSFSDPAGNRTDEESAALLISDKPDTTAPVLLQLSPQASQVIDFRNPEVLISFDEGVTFASFSRACSFRDSTKKIVPVSLRRINDAFFSLAVDSLLKPFEAYSLQLDFSLLKDAAGNFRDTVVSNIYPTLNELNLTGLTGTCKNIDTTRNPVLVLESVERTPRRYYTTPGNDGTFTFDRILPGKFIVWLFYDADKNGVYTHGTFLPFTFSEEFRMSKKSVELTPRWIVTEYSFDYGAE